MHQVDAIFEQTPGPSRLCIGVPLDDQLKSGWVGCVLWPQLWCSEARQVPVAHHGWWVRWACWALSGLCLPAAACLFRICIGHAFLPICILAITLAGSRIAQVIRLQRVGAIKKVTQQHMQLHPHCLHTHPGFLASNCHTATPLYHHLDVMGLPLNESPGVSAAAPAASSSSSSGATMASAGDSLGMRIKA